MANVLVLIPMKPTLLPALRERATTLLGALVAKEQEGAHTIDARIRLCPEEGDNRKYSSHAAARNAMLALYLRKKHTHVLWVDADLVDYPANLASLLLDTDPASIVAPFPLIEESARFYDVRGFVDIEGRRAKPWPDYLEGGDLIPMKAVGACYLAPAEVYKRGARYEPMGNETEHYSVCEAARESGIGVWAARRLVVRHADLPRWGEQWH